MCKEITRGRGGRAIGKSIQSVCRDRGCKCRLVPTMLHYLPLDETIEVLFSHYVCA